MPHTVPSADLRALVKETQRMVRHDQEVTMLWWMPHEFFRAVLARSAIAQAEQQHVLSDAIEALVDYEIFALMHARVMGGALSNGSSREELQRNAQFEVGGETRSPIAIEDIPATVQSIIAGMKPSLAQSAGIVARYLEILVYPAVRPRANVRLFDGARLMTFTLFGRQFQWSLPLASLAPENCDAAVA